MDPIRDRIDEQFTYRSDRADVWRVFDSFLETDAFLNLGYSEWYQPHATGASQRRLAAGVGRTLSSHLPETSGVGLLDVGCGRGGPAVLLADRFGFRVTGVDLVRYNVARARANARARASDAEFVVGDATRLPVGSDSMAAAVAIDSLVYLPDREAVVPELADALEQGGIVVVTDLVARPDATGPEQGRIARFAEAWDMPPPGTVAEYERAFAGAGFEVLAVEDITAHSVGQFRKWTTLFTWLHTGWGGRVIDRLLESRDLDAATIAEQVERAHEALPSLRHVMLVARR